MISRTPGELVSEMVMRRTSHKGSFLVVEGVTDSRFWKSRVSPECGIVIGDGKQTVLKAVHAALGQRLTGIVGLVDDDLDLIFGCRDFSGHIVHTDSHDLEVLLATSAAFNKLVAEFGNADLVLAFRRDRGELIDEALRTALPFGRVRWWSRHSGAHANLDTVSVYKFVRPDLTVKSVELFEHVGKLTSQRPGQIEKEVDILSKSHPNHVVVQGHELIDVLVIAFRDGAWGKTSLHADQVATALRLAFEDAMLRKTQMARDLLLWESKNPTFRVLP